MNRLDAAVIAVLVLSMLVGLYRGFIRELLSLATLVLALFVAVNFSGIPLMWLQDIGWGGILLPGSGLQWVIMSSLLFLSVLSLGQLTVRLVFGALRQDFVVAASRFLGGVLGVTRGGGFVVVLVFLAGFTALPFYQGWRESSLIPVFERSVQYLACHVPPEYRSRHHYGCMP